ncbi:uncharacterized protein [Clytia hemisphaerica]|uniref:Major facilitator superfamily (MFS) profile domain-containing protein n=1 Tax=Clytia hemisphaerica TaxID=252671 RepID=A0A7M5WLG9_9CNID
MENCNTKEINKMEKTSANRISSMKIKVANIFKHINVKLIPVKLAFIFYYSSIGAWWPYMMLFLTSLGLNPFLAGLCICVRTVVSTFSVPFWGFISDFTGRQHIVYVILTLGYAATTLSGPIIATKLNHFDRNSTVNGSMNVHDSNTTLLIRNSTLFDQRTPHSNHNLTGLYLPSISRDYETNSTDPIVKRNSNSSFSQSKLDKHSIETDNQPLYCTSECSDNRMFTFMIILSICMGLFEFSLPGFIDVNVMTVTSKHPKTSFGFQRVFGSAGYAFGSVLAGFVADRFQHQTLTTFSAPIFVSVPFLVAGLPFYVMLALMAKKVTSETKDDPEDSEEEDKSTEKCKAVSGMCKAMESTPSVDNKGYQKEDSFDTKFVNELYIQKEIFGQSKKSSETKGYSELNLKDNADFPNKKPLSKSKLDNEFNESCNSSHNNGADKKNENDEGSNSTDLKISNLSSSNSNKDSTEDDERSTSKLAKDLHESVKITDKNDENCDNADLKHSNQSNKKYINNTDDDSSTSNLTGIELLKLTTKTCLQPSIFVLLLTTLINGIALSFMNSFMFLHMKDAMGSPDTVLGFNITSMIAGEIIFFLITKTIINKFGSFKCLVVSLFGNGVRFILMAFCKNPWLTLPIQLLHGVGYALFFASTIEIAYEFSPQVIRTTIFSIIGSLFFSVANVIGNLLGGWIYETYKGLILFLVTGILCSAWSIVIGFYYLMPKPNRK